MSDLIMFLIMTNFGNQPSRSILEYLINVHLVWTNLWKFCQKSNFSWSCKFVQIRPIPHLIHTFPAAEWISEFSKSSFQANHWLNFLLGPSVCVLDFRCWTAFHTFKLKFWTILLGVCTYYLKWRKTKLFVLDYCNTSWAWLVTLTQLPVYL